MTFPSTSKKGQSRWTRKLNDWSWPPYTPTEPRRQIDPRNSRRRHGRRSTPRQLALFDSAARETEVEYSRHRSASGTGSAASDRDARSACRGLRRAREQSVLRCRRLCGPASAHLRSGPQVLSLEKLHYGIGMTVALPDVVTDDDVGVRKRRDYRCLPLEARKRGVRSAGGPQRYISFPLVITTFCTSSFRRRRQHLTRISATAHGLVRTPRPDVGHPRA